jgi:putative transposase
MELNEVYFWTNTVKDWKNLLTMDKYKIEIINQLRWLKERRKISVYGYVIMPNHMHILWEMLEMNGKEMPYASFNKWISSRFLKDLRANHPKVLPHFREDAKDRNHRFWQRDPLAVIMNNKKTFEQKLHYIHTNPLQEKWNLSQSPEQYRWSSASFYEKGNDEFQILTHYLDRF